MLSLILITKPVTYLACEENFTEGHDDRLHHRRKREILSITTKPPLKPGYIDALHFSFGRVEKIAQLLYYMKFN